MSITPIKESWPKTPRNSLPQTPRNDAFNDSLEFTPLNLLIASVLNSTPRKRKRLLTPSHYDLKNDAFSDHPNISPVCSAPLPSVSTKDDAIPHRATKRKALDTSSDMFEGSFQSTPKRQRRSSDIQSPLSHRNNQSFGYLPLLPTTPTALNLSSNCDINCTPHVNSTESYRAMLEGKRILEEIGKRSAKKVQPTPSTSPLATVNSVTCLTPVVKRKSISQRLIDYSPSPCNGSELNESIPSDVSLNELESCEDLPPTQPVSAFILQGVVAYVEVRTSVDSEGKGIKAHLQSLGAVVSKSFTKQVTHVVFMNGKYSTYKKALARNVPLVSVRWIEECKRRKVKVSERLYPSNDIEKLESPAAQEARTRKPLFPGLSALKKKIATKRQKKAPSPVRNDDRENSDSLLVPCVETANALTPKPKRKSSVVRHLVRTLADKTELTEGKLKEVVDNCNSSNVRGGKITRILRSQVESNNIGKSSSSLRTGMCGIGDNVNLLSNRIDSDKDEGNVCISSHGESQEIPEVNQKHKSPGQSSKTISPRRLFVEAEGKCSENYNSQSANSQVVSGTQLNHSRRARKRKLFPLSETPTLLTPTDDEPIAELTQNPYVVPKVPCAGPSQSRSSARNCVRKLNKKYEVLTQASVSLDSRPLLVPFRRRKSRHSLDFVPMRQREPPHIVSSSQPVSSTDHKLPSIVCTGLHSEEVGIILCVVEKLGKYVVEDKVTERTTHVVTREPKRTLKLLKGMARGCWIVKQEWILRSLEEGKWLDEDEFEMTEFSPAVQQYRLERISFGAAFKPDLFASCGPIYVKKHCKNTPPKQDIEELLTLCGGKVTSNIRCAQLIIGEASRRNEQVKCVSAKWVLDSITYNMLQTVNNYTLMRL